MCGVSKQFRAFTYIDLHASGRVCFTANTQMTNFSFQVRQRSHPLNTSFWADPYKIAQVFFPAHGLLFWDAFLKKRMAPPSWKPEGIAKCRLECCN